MSDELRLTSGGLPMLHRRLHAAHCQLPTLRQAQDTAGCWPKAFTLVELLVVVVIVGILAGVAVPRLLGARDRAGVARCAGNLRAIHVALGLYRVDYGRYPLADGQAGDVPSPGKTVPGKGPAANGSWDGVPLVLHRLGYVADRNVLFCPVMKRLAGERQEYFRYAYNAGTSDTGSYAGSSNNIERDEGEIWLARCVYLRPEETFTPNTWYPFPHHNRQAENVLYTDGRVVLEEARRTTSGQ